MLYEIQRESEAWWLGQTVAKFEWIFALLSCEYNCVFEIVSIVFMNKNMPCY